MSDAWKLFCILSKLDNIETLCEAALGNDDLRNPAFLDILRIVREPIPANTHADEFPLRRLITDARVDEDF